MSPLVIAIQTEGGALPGEWFASPSRSSTPVTLVFAHGAGAGHRSPFMRRVAAGLAEAGVPVLTFDFPYMANGRKLPDKAPVLEAAFRRAVEAVRDHAGPGLRGIAVGGKSLGGRMATHLAAAPEVWPGGPPLVGAVAFGYPLRPPGPRASDRVSHLPRLSVPTLVVQGTRDPFGGPDDVRAAATAAPMVEVYPVETGDHSLKTLASTGRRPAETERRIVSDVAAWLLARVPGDDPPAR